MMTISKLPLFSYAFIALTVLLPIRNVVSLGLHQQSIARSKPPMIVCRMPHCACKDSRDVHNGKNEITSFYSPQKWILDGETHGGDKALLSLHTSLGPVMRSMFANGLAFALVWFSAVESSTAETFEPTRNTFDTTGVLIASTIAPTESSAVGTSAGGNLVLGAWIGISGYAGIKGIWDKYQSYQQDQKEEK